MMKAAKILTALKRIGLLLEHDATLPSVTAMVAGGPVKGSWWGHAKGNEMFNLLGELFEHRDVAFAKLVNGKVTLIHRALWPALLGAATSGEPWQTAGLSKPASALLKRVRAAAILRTTGDAARELERRLLAHGTSVHTESGDHAKALQTWERWARERRVKPAPKASLDRALARLGGGRLPWTERYFGAPAPVKST
jgi:hypothetical protein